MAFFIGEQVTVGNRTGVVVAVRGKGPFEIPVIRYTGYLTVAVRKDQVKQKKK